MKDLFEETQKQKCIPRRLVLIKNVVSDQFKCKKKLPESFEKSFLRQSTLFEQQIAKLDLTR